MSDIFQQAYIFFDLFLDRKSQESNLLPIVDQVLSFTRPWVLFLFIMEVSLKQYEQHSVIMYIF